MCGINGFNFKDDELIVKMSSYTRSRGPDYTDYFKSVNYSVSHNRLAIIDPEDRSNQPFRFKNLILSFNGEIYNFLELKEKLIDKGYNFTTNSDTEVIIKLFYEYKEESFKFLSGIFALSIYDTETNNLYLIRQNNAIRPSIELIFFPLS